MRKLFFISLLFCALPIVASAQNEKKKVMVMEIKAEIDPRMSRYVKLALEHAEKPMPI
jgi:membrane-bound serine protease (ClpP class)